VLATVTPELVLATFSVLPETYTPSSVVSVTELTEPEAPSVVDTASSAVSVVVVSEALAISTVVCYVSVPSVGVSAVIATPVVV
jgi:hypothetical protein